MTVRPASATGGVIALGIVVAAVVAVILDAVAFWELFGPSEDAISGFVGDAPSALLAGIMAGLIVAGTREPLVAAAAGATLGVGIAYLGRLAARGLSVSDPPPNPAIEVPLLIVIGIAFGLLGGLLGRRLARYLRARA